MIKYLVFLCFFTMSLAVQSATVYMTESGAGSQSGADENNAISKATFDSTAYTSADTVIACGNFTRNSGTWIINDAGLTIDGDTCNAPFVINQTNSSLITAITIQANDVTLEGLTTNGTHGWGIDITAISGVTLRRINNNIDNTKGIRILAQQNTQQSNFTFEDITCTYVNPADTHQEDDCFSMDSGVVGGSFRNLFIHGYKLVDPGHSGINIGVTYGVGQWDIQNVYISDIHCPATTAPYGRCWDIKSPVTNWYLTRVLSTNHRAPSQISGTNGNVYNTLTINHKNQCEFGTDSGCTYGYSSFSDAEFFGTGMATSILDVNGTIKILNNTWLNIDGSCVSSIDPPTTLIMENNICHNSVLKPSDSDSPPGSIATRNDYAFWFQDQLSNHITASYNIVSGSGSVWGEGSSGVPNYAVGALANSVNILTATNNSGADPLLDANGVPQENSPAIGAGKTITTLVDPAGLLPAHMALDQTFADDWTYENGNTQTRTGAWDIGAIVYASEPDPDPEPVAEVISEDIIIPLISLVYCDDGTYGTVACTDNEDFPDNEYGIVGETYANYIGAPFDSPTVVNNQSTFNTAWNNMVAGSKIMVLDNSPSINVTDFDTPSGVDGTVNDPIIVYAESHLGATLTGTTKLDLYASYMTLAGFNVQIRTDCYDNNQRHLWNKYTGPRLQQGIEGSTFGHVSVFGFGCDDVEIAYNEYTFPNVGDGGQIIEIQQFYSESGQATSVKRPWIHHNWIHDISSAQTQTNIVLGFNYEPLDPVYGGPDGDPNINALVENNLFERTFGDWEIISIKSSGNIIRNNCAKDNGPGQFTLRGGDNNLVYGQKSVGMENAGFPLAGESNVYAFNAFAAKLDFNAFWAMELHSTWQDANPVYSWSDWQYKVAKNNLIDSNVFEGFNSQYRIYGGSTESGQSSAFVDFEAPNQNTIANNHFFPTSGNLFTDSTGGAVSLAQFQSTNTETNNSTTQIAASTARMDDCDDVLQGHSAGNSAIAVNYTYPQDPDLTEINPPSWWTSSSFDQPSLGDLAIYPGAVGHGADATGGRGGYVCVYENLNDSGAGSARSCFEASGTRVIMPAIAGTIVLNSELNITDDNWSFYGGMAPGTVILKASETANNNGLFPSVINNTSSNSFMEYATIFTPAASFVSPNSANCCRDAINHGRVGTNNSTNIIYKNLTVLGADDEQIDSIGVDGLNIAYSILGRPLNNSVNPAGAAGKSSLMGLSSVNTTYYRNLFKDTSGRAGLWAPTSGNARFQFVNNILSHYKWGQELDNRTGNTMVGDIINNYYQSVLSSWRDIVFYVTTPNRDYDIYINGNSYEGGSIVLKDSSDNTLSRPSTHEALTPTAGNPVLPTIAANDLIANQLQNMGNNIYPDSVTSQLITETQNNTGKIYDCVDNRTQTTANSNCINNYAGPVPITNGTTCVVPTSVQIDGISSATKIAFGLSANDNTAIMDGPGGWSMLEHIVHRRCVPE